MNLPPSPRPAEGGDAGSAATAASGPKRAPPWGGPAADKIAVIGAGYAGLAAAVELAAAGRQVEVFEASRVPGGRARAVQIEGFTVDNGQHILIGAYTETLRLMRAVGADPDVLLRRTPLRFEFPGEFVMSAPRLPAPLHTAFALLLARGLDWGEKWAAIRLMRGLQAGQFRIEPDITVTAWLDSNKTPSRQRRLLWEPLCIAALNTPAERASAQVLANVLRDSLASSRSASDMLLPQVDLSALFPEPAAEFIARHGGAVQLGRRVSSLRREGDAWWIDDAGPFAQVILAVAPYHLGNLVPELAPQVAHFDWEPIVTSYFSYPDWVRLPQPMLGVDAGLAQWLFDRGQLCEQYGLIAAVISARGRHLDLPMAELERGIHKEIVRLVPDLPAPLAVQTITEKRATFACVPNLQRPQARTEMPGLWLAGDYVDSDYPATLEGAVRSGVAAAHSILGEKFRRPQ
ncbi:MAG: squalene-associated FAD-dependent desaturase [Rhodocyclaceae bacterium]|nr:MAG: squalene-associated FAD-dependent desaturase [Rhodocyclaceae bacterium]TND01056.1 MAG: squalene-associated FAD-dependent desaturase [Rhodocyclaceae bacterium]